MTDVGTQNAPFIAAVHACKLTEIPRAGCKMLAMQLATGLSSVTDTIESLGFAYGTSSTHLNVATVKVAVDVYAVFSVARDGAGACSIHHPSAKGMTHTAAG